METTILIFVIILGIWIMFGVIWDIKYDVGNTLDYTPGTIFIGGPTWWIFAFLFYMVRVCKKKSFKINFKMPVPKKRKGIK